MTKEEFETYVKTVVPEKSVCVVQCPDEQILQVSTSLGELSKNLFHLNIIFVACPENFKITVIPSGSNLKIE